MKIRVAVLADYALVSQDGKLSVLGIFSVIRAMAEPVVHPAMNLVAQYEFESSEAGKKDISVVLRDEDGRILFRLDGELDIARPPVGKQATANQILQIQNAHFPRFGEYEFQILIGGEVKAEIPFSVQKPITPSPS